MLNLKSNNKTLTHCIRIMMTYSVSYKLGSKTSTYEGRSNLIEYDGPFKYTHCYPQGKQEVSLKKIIVEGYRAVGSLNDSFQSSNFLLLLLLFYIDCGQW